MVMRRVPFRPGIVKDDTEYSQEGTWTDGDHVRFRRARPQKIGGFVKITDDTFTGTVRGMHAWRDNSSIKYLSLNTHVKNYVFTGGSIHDITPVRSSGSLGSDPFTTANESTAVTVAHTDHGVAAGDYVTFASGDAVGGLDLDATFTVTSVTSANAYVITASSAASSTATGGGASVTFIYELTTGREDGVPGLGWGTGTWGSSTWSTARSASDLQARTTSAANFGENLLLVPRYQGLYQWSLSTTAVAARVTTAPTSIGSMFVSPQRHVFLLGTDMDAAGTTGTYNPMRVMFSDQEDSTSYVTTATNLAGDVVLAEGNLIVAGKSTRLVNLIWTDHSLYTARHIGDIDFVHEFQLAGTSCGLVGPNAAAIVDGRAYWMASNQQFYMYGGGQPQVIPCPVQDHIFDNIDAAQREKVYASHNSMFNEIWWLYPHDSTECDRYVTYNYVENVWSVGTFDRSAMIDRGVYDEPYMAGTDTYLYSHENGVDANGAVFSGSITSAPFDLEDGERVLELRRIVPDVTLSSGGSVFFQVRHRRYPVATQTTEASRQVTETTSKLDYRVQARQVSLKISNNGVGDDWRLGDIRMDITQGGYR